MVKAKTNRLILDNKNLFGHKKILTLTRYMNVADVWKGIGEKNPPLRRVIVRNEDNNMRPQETVKESGVLSSDSIIHF